MNKPTKIVPLDADESQPLEKVAQPAKPAKQERGSLLERASGAFGLDRLMPARVFQGPDVTWFFKVPSAP